MYQVAGLGVQYTKANYAGVAMLTAKHGKPLSKGHVASGKRGIEVGNALNCSKRIKAAFSCEQDI